MEEEKALVWIGSSKKDLLKMPEDVRRTMGYVLGKVQNGEGDEAIKLLTGRKEFKGGKRVARFGRFVTTKTAIPIDQSSPLNTRKPFISSTAFKRNQSGESKRPKKTLTESWNVLRQSIGSGHRRTD